MADTQSLKKNLASMMGGDVDEPTTTPNPTTDEGTTNEFTSPETADESKPKTKDAEGYPRIKLEDGTYRDRTPEEKREYDEKQAERKARAESRDKVRRQLNSNSLTDTEKEVRAEFEKHARIVGYVVARDKKVDFAAKTTKINPRDPNSESTTSVVLKQFAPSGIKLAIVKYPVALYDLITLASTMEPIAIKEKLQEFRNTLKPVAGGKSAVDYRIEYIPYDQLLGWMKNYTLGILFEDTEIFAPIYKKSKDGDVTKIDNPSTAKVKSKLPKPGSYLYIDIANVAPVKTVKDEAGNVTTKIDVKNITKLRHSLRSKPITDKNYIALNSFETISLAPNYEKEKMEQMINLYLHKFTKKPNGGNKNGVATQSVAERISDGSLTVSGSTITGSKYFALTGKTPEWYNTGAINDWFAKSPTTGVAQVIPANAIRLVKKELVASADGTESKVVTKTKALTKANFTAANYGAIFKAAGGALVWEDLEAAVESLKSRRPTNDETKVVTTFDPSLAITNSNEAIAEALESYQLVAQPKSDEA